MLSENWGAIAKAGGVAILTAILAMFVYAATIPYGQSLKQEAANKAAIARDNAEYAIKWVCSAHKAEKDCVEETRQTESENTHNAEDLSAQKLSAWWAQVMTVAALIGMGLSAVGVFLVYTTFDETRKANKIAMRANARATCQAVASAAETAKALEIAERNANTAIKQVEISEMTAKRHLRAYVDTDIGSIGIDDSGRLLIDLQIRNFGKTPAKKVQSVIQSYIGKHPLEGDLPALIGEVEKSSVSIGQGSFVEFLHTHVSPLTGKDVEKIIDEELAIYVYGKITYNDIFGEKQTTKYCMFCTGGEGAELGRFAGHHTGNEST
jgi:hypothetical protein